MGILKRATGEQVTASATVKMIRAFLDVENAALVLEPVFADLYGVIQQLRERQQELKKLERELPDRARAWLTGHFLDNAFDRIFRGIATHAQAIVLGQGQPANFSESMSDLFSSAISACETIEATLNGGGVGRKLYRVSDGSIPGLAGLMLHQGDEIALLAAHPHTQKFLGSGNLILLEREK